MVQYTEIPNNLPEWTPGQDICIIINDVDGIPRTAQEINDMFDVLRCAAHNAGFDLSAWGLRPSFEKAIEKKYVRAKIAETVKARDLQLAQMYPQCEFLKTAAPTLPEVDH